MADEVFKKMEGMLYGYKHIDTQIKNLNICIKKLDEDIYDESPSYGDKSSPTNKFSSTVENHVISRSEEIEKLNKKIAKLKYDKELIENALTTLSKKESDFVQYRYFSGDKPTMDCIADKMFIGRCQCAEIRKNTIMKLIKLVMPDIS